MRIRRNRHILQSSKKTISFLPTCNLERRTRIWTLHQQRSSNSGDTNRKSFEAMNTLLFRLTLDTWSQYEKLTTRYESCLKNKWDHHAIGSYTLYTQKSIRRSITNTPSTVLLKRVIMLFNDQVPLVIDNGWRNSTFERNLPLGQNNYEELSIEYLFATCCQKN